MMRYGSWIRLLTLAALLLPLRVVAEDAFAIVPERPASAVLKLPSPQQVVALRYGHELRDDLRKLDDWQPHAGGLMVFDDLGDRASAHHFQVEYASGEILWVGERAVSALARRNLRDLGGYRTADGRHVRPGLLYRSGRLDNLSAAEERALRALGIRSLCDFRTRAEIDEHLNPDVGMTLVEGCLDTHSADLTGALAALVEQEKRGEPVDWAGVMVSSYRDMGVRYADQFRALFGRLHTAESYPVLFRCTGGKDRTGVAAAILLTALGVPEDTVIADYHLSEVYPVPSEDLTAFPVALLEIPELAATHPDYIRSALAGIRERHGSVARYVQDVLGVSAADMAALRERLLDDGV